ncbi:MAG: PAS domain-containing protein [Pseudomonadota bacterium]
MKHQTSFKLYRYWTRMRGDRLAPRRSEIEPADIREILAETFVLNADTEMAYRYRLAGSRASAPYCRELKGRDFLSLWSGNDARAMETLLQGVCEDAAAAVVGWEGGNLRGQTLMFETLLLPLETEHGRYERILGSTAAADTPYWLGIHPVIEQSIVSLRMIWPNEAASEQADAEAPVAFKPAASDPAPALTLDPRTGQIARRRGHLLVYDGGREPETADLHA